MTRKKRKSYGLIKLDLGIQAEWLAIIFINIIAVFVVAWSPETVNTIIAAQLLMSVFLACLSGMTKEVKQK